MKNIGLENMLKNLVSYWSILSTIVILFRDFIEYQVALKYEEFYGIPSTYFKKFSKNAYFESIILILALIFLLFIFPFITYGFLKDFSDQIRYLGTLYCFLFSIIFVSSLAFLSYKGIKTKFKNEILNGILYFIIIIVITTILTLIVDKFYIKNLDIIEFKENLTTIESFIISSVLLILLAVYIISSIYLSSRNKVWNPDKIKDYQIFKKEYNIMDNNENNNENKSTFVVIFDYGDNILAAPCKIEKESLIIDSSNYFNENKNDKFFNYRFFSNVKIERSRKESTNV